MARRPKPWYRKDRKAWFATIDGKRHRLGADRKQAYQRFHELMAKPQKRQVDGESVPAVIDAFLEWTKRNRASRTYDWYLERLQWFVSFVPRDLVVDELKPFHVQEWIDSKSCSNGHKRGCVTAVLRAMNWAQRMGHIERNPIAGFEKPAAGRRETVVPEADFKWMLGLTNDEEFRDLLVAAWETGARPQELTRVEARHVDLANRRWVFEIEESKGKKRQRVVYLSEQAIEITRRLLLKHPEGALFLNSRGRPWSRNAVKCRFGRMKNDLGTRYRLYDFRHTFATRLLEQGVDALVVAALMGHSDLSMLGRTYAHLTQNSDHLLQHLNRKTG